MTKSEATAPRPYSWLLILISVLPVIMLMIGAIAFRYIETRMIATTGETLALSASEVSDKVDRFLMERHADAVMMASVFSVQPHNLEFQSAYVARMKTAYPDYLWIGTTNAHGQIVVATDPNTIGRDYSAQSWFQAVRNGQGVHMGDVEPFAVMGGPDAIAVTAPITGPRGEFLGVVTTRVGISGLENVMTGTLLAFRQREGFWGALEYQFLIEEGVAFIDSDLHHKGHVNLKQLGLPSALLSESSPSSYVEEEHKRRHVPVITGYAKTRAHGGFDGMRWTVLMRMDRSDVLAPIREVLWNLGLAGGAVVIGNLTCFVACMLLSWGLGDDFFLRLLFVELRRHTVGLHDQCFRLFECHHLFAAIDRERYLAGDTGTGLDRDRDAEALLERAQMGALVVERVKRDLRARAHSLIVGRALEQDLLERAQELQRYRRDRAHVGHAAGGLVPMLEHGRLVGGNADDLDLRRNHLERKIVAVAREEPDREPEAMGGDGGVERGAARTYGFAEAVERDVSDGDEVRRAHARARA